MKLVRIVGILFHLSGRRARQGRGLGGMGSGGEVEWQGGGRKFRVWREKGIRTAKGDGTSDLQN